MAKNANFVSHKKSKLKNQDGSPQLPSSSALVEGEIAINFAENVETLSIKNESGDVVTFSSDNYYSEKKLGSAFTGANSAVTVTDAIEENEKIIATALNDLNERKLDASAYTPTDLSNYYTKDETSGATELDTAFSGKQNTLSAGTGIDITDDVISLTGEPIVIDQVIDSGTSASTNAVATHAVYEALVDDELVWTNAFISMSGIVGTHITDTNMHITSGDRTKLNSITGHVGTMAYENASSYSSATEVNTALAGKTDSATTSALNDVVTGHTTDTTIHVTSADKTAWNAKVDASAIANFFDDAKYEDSGTTKVINFYHGNTIKATIDASDFIVDGMVDDVRIENGNLVIDFNTASGKQDISIPLTDIFDPSNYYNKTVIDNLVGSGFTSSSITDVIIENEEIVSAALTDLDNKKLDASAYTPTDLSNYYTKSETSGATEISNALGGKVNTSDIVSAITPSNSASTAPIATKVVAENEEIIATALTDLDNKKLDASAYTPTEELWVSGTGLNSVVLKGSSGTASGDYSVAEGYSYEYDGDTYTSIASGSYSHTEGSGTNASGDWGSHAEGDSTSATSDSSHAEGYSTLASGEYSHAEGDSTSATSYVAHAEGEYSLASGDESHAEGRATKAAGEGSHAEGDNTEANGYASHAEGDSTSATSYVAHAEGYRTLASGDESHAEGLNTIANGYVSHTEGVKTIANNDSEHASGQYNISHSATTEFGDSGNTLFSVGNGYYDGDAHTVVRHNAFEIMQNGDIYIVSGGTDIKLQDNIGKVDVISAITPSNSGSTSPIATKVVAENELVITNALTDLDDRKLDASAYTPTDLSNYYTKDETSGKTEISTALGTKVNSATFTAHTADTTIHLTSGDVQTQIDNSISGKVDTNTFNTIVGSGYTNTTITEVIENMDTAIAAALTDLDNKIGDIESILATI